MASGTRSQSRGREEREETPEPGPKKFNSNTPAAQVKTWQRLYRGLANANWRDVCQLCGEVGHQATSCDTFVSIIKDGKKWRDAEKLREQRHEQEARSELAKANKRVREVKAWANRSSAGLVLFFLGIVVFIHSFVKDLVTAQTLCVLALTLGGVVATEYELITEKLAAWLNPLKVDIGRIEDRDEEEEEEEHN